MNLDNYTIFESIEQLNEYLARPQGTWHKKKGRFYFENCYFNFDVNFEYGVDIFPTHVYFSNSIFQGKTSFKGILFQGKANFDNCKFIKQADFTGCSFEKDVKFHDTTFEKDSVFNESEFKEKVNAWKMTFGENVDFKWTNFRKKVNFSELNAESGKVNLYGVNFESNAYFYDSKIKQLDLKKTVIDKGLFFLGAEIDNLKRESARIIKNEFIKQNNKIEALKFHAKEMEAYQIELQENRKQKNKNYSFWDSCILNLNRYSNKYGLNPGTGFIFTLLVSLGFFFLYFLTLETYPIKFSLDSTIKDTFSSIGIVASHFIEFINPTHKASFLIDYTGTWSIFVDYFSRIFIGFGIYQTIQSFRKYGRF